jgi:hypothetical protein
MATAISWPPIGGTAYSVPATAEVGWQALSNYLIALADAQGTTNQKIGIRVATATPVTVVSASDYAIVINLSVAGAVAVTLPAGVSGQLYAIIDGKGDAATNNITITPNGAETINGGATYVIKENRGAVILAFVSSNWSVISEFVAATNQGSTGTGLIVRQTTPTIITPNITTSARMQGTNTTDAVTLTLRNSDGSKNSFVLQDNSTGSNVTNGVAYSLLLASQSGIVFSGDSNANQGDIATTGRWTIGTGTSTTHRLNTVVGTTVGAAGAASALPATPTGYITMNINGTDRKIPYYDT